jgi:hypothetical protein
MNYDFFNGIVTAFYFVACLFFIRFWRKTKKIIFPWFAVAFAVLAIQPFLIWALSLTPDQGASLYYVRLLGFTLVISGIVAANLKGPRA